MHIQPMLASNEEWDLKDLRYPVIVSPKYDGIRAIRHSDYCLLTRREKEVPNLYIRERIMSELVHYKGLFDGEIICGANYHATESAVMSKQHDREDDFRFVLFDYVSRSLSTTYTDRLEDLSKVGSSLQYCLIAPTRVVNDEENLLFYARYYEEQGMEGIIIRNPNGPYKKGRCSVASQFMLKYVRYETGEATVVGWEPAMENLDTSCKKKANLVPKKQVGSLRLVNVRWPSGFSVGSGWDRSTAEIWYQNPDLILGKTVKFKYKPYGTKDAPRQPVFVGFRNIKVD